MRCPKCRYISFDAGDRCRNCGYEFSLTVPASPPMDLDIQTGNEPLGPLTDLGLSALDAPAAAHESLDAPMRKRQTSNGLELPLFRHSAIDADTPLVNPPAVPRPPLAVRKSSPAMSRAASRSRTGDPEFDLGLLDADWPSADAPQAQPAPAPAPPHDDRTAPVVRRVAAAVIDAILLCAVDLAILYFAMRLCGLQVSEVGKVPRVPFASFVLLQNGAYLVAFVAIGGQTIGKMMMGIKVVLADRTDGWSDGVPLGTAIVRAAAWFLTVLPAGIGVLPAMFGAQRRAVHDRLAGTRVVKA